MVKIEAIILVCLIAVASSTPLFWGKKHEHVVIHVPYHVHTDHIHHHHVKNIPIIRPIIKHVPIVNQVQVPYPVHVPVHVPVHHIHEEIPVPVHHEYSLHPAEIHASIW
jgi:hypothetical protein